MLLQPIKWHGFIIYYKPHNSLRYCYFVRSESYLFLFQNQAFLQEIVGRYLCCQEVFTSKYSYQDHNQPWCHQEIKI